MNRKLIQGTLIPSNREAAVSTAIRNKLYRVLRENELRQIVRWDTKWEENGIEFKRSSPVHTGRKDAIKFINALDNVMKSDPAIALNLSGRITVVLETGEEPIVIRVTVKEGSVSYQEAEYIWPEKTPV